MDKDEEINKTSKIQKNTLQGQNRNFFPSNEDPSPQESLPDAGPGLVHAGHQNPSSHDPPPHSTPAEDIQAATQPPSDAIKFATSAHGAAKTAITATVAVKNATAAPADAPDVTSTTSTHFFSNHPQKESAENLKVRGTNAVFTEACSSKDRLHSKPLGFSGEYGRVLGINCSEEDLSHPPGFSNQRVSISGNSQSVSGGIGKTNSFLNELQKTIAMGEMLGYNMDGCMDSVTEILKGHVERQVPK